MPEKNKQKFFIDWILDNSQKDKGFSAKMRRADNPDQEYYALGILCGFDIDIEKESERLPYSVVGAALCRAQVESDGSLGLGEALRICESLKASESGEKTLILIARVFADYSPVTVYRNFVAAYALCFLLLLLEIFHCATRNFWKIFVVFSMITLART